MYFDNLGPLSHQSGLHLWGVSVPAMSDIRKTAVLVVLMLWNWEMSKMERSLEQWYSTFLFAYTQI
jgi:hypothetical protein